MFGLDGFWLTPGERQECIAQLVEAGLLKWSNNVDLPLKSGGKTDIYVNLRMMRETPWSIRYLGGLFANALRRMDVDRFLEIPEAVSPMAGYISALTGIPMVTVRDQAKEGRVVAGTLIGDLRRGEVVAGIDDVVTDGASKIPMLIEVPRVGAKLAGIIALVDRQGGWEKKLSAAGHGSTRFWFGMNLHHIRRYLIEQGLMKRCDPIMEAMNPIIVALDGKSWDELIPTLINLRASGCILKVNDLLFEQGMHLIPDLSVYGRVMVDLKGHDIPNTVGNICKRLRAYKPWAVTVHASGGSQMVKAAKTELEGGSTNTKVLAVTVLTSIDEATCKRVYHERPLRQVMALASEAANGGADGFVCSAKEVKPLSTEYPGKIFVVPGVRSLGQEAGDQKRVDTPRNAMKHGATNLVMGRQILNAPNPVDEVRRVLEEELDIEF